MKKAVYNYVLFDWDGCLANSVDLWVECIQEGLRDLGIEATKEQVIRNVIVKYDNVVKLGVTDSKKFGLRLNELIVKNATKMMLNPSAREVVSELKQRGKKVAIVTSSGRTGLEIAMDNLGILDMFDVLVTHEDVSHLKPDPEGILKALQAMGGTPAEAIMFGDTRNDILGGKNARTATGLYFPEEHEAIYDKDHLLGLCADYYMRKLDDVLEIVI